MAKTADYRFTDVERDTLRMLIAEALRDGSYYGRRDQYRARLIRMDAELLKAVSGGQRP